MKQTIDATEPRAALDSYLTAIERKDAAATVAMLTSDAVTFDFAPPLANKASDFADTSGLEEWFSGWDGPIGTEVRDPFTTVVGDIAVMYGLQRLHGKKVEGPDVDMWYRCTVMLRREEEGWRIAHVHNSVPMAMDGSGKALVDLQP